MRKIGSLITLALGGGAIFFGYNTYIGDYRLYSRTIMPLIHMAYRAEPAHILAVKAARHGIVPRIPPDDPEVTQFLRTNFLGIDLENPVGLAAGFDKDGEAITGLAHFGFGFIEVGSVTPEPQRGNFFPRVFRLPADRAIINRYGFNNLGHRNMADNLDRQAAQIRDHHIVVGVNLGKNRNTTDPIGDYVQGLKHFYPLDTVRYFVINISSPNTPNLRQMQNSKQLTELLNRVLREKRLLDRSDSESRKPLLLKIAPDLSDDQVRDIASVIQRFSKPAADRAPIDGLIISNTTIERANSLRSESKLIAEEGGLSGPPVRDRSTELIRQMYRLTNGSIPIIGVGGIESGADAYEKIIAGASAVQLYTSMAYFGPPIVKAVKTELALFLHANGYTNVREAIGAEHRDGEGNRKKIPHQLQVDSASTAPAAIAR